MRISTIDADEEMTSDQSTSDQECIYSKTSASDYEYDSDMSDKCDAYNDTRTLLKAVSTAVSIVDNTVDDDSALDSLALKNHKDTPPPFSFLHDLVESILDSWILPLHELSENVVVNYQSLNKFIRLYACERFKYPDLYIGYHGTHRANAASIMKEHFMIPGISPDGPKMQHGRAYGRGVYWSEDKQVALKYANQGVLFVCISAPGLWKECNLDHDPEAHCGGSTQYNIAVVRDPIRLLPLFMMPTDGQNCTMYISFDTIISTIMNHIKCVLEATDERNLM